MPLDFDAVQPAEEDRRSMSPSLRRVRREIYRDFDPVWASSVRKEPAPVEEEPAGPVSNVRLLYGLSAVGEEGAVV